MPNHKVKLVMVEDDPMLCEGWAEIFDIFGFDARFFHTANALFLEIDSIGNCDVLITDFYLPDLNGIDVIHRVRKLYPDLPVILLTGSREPAIVNGLSAIPRTLLLFKPVDIDELGRAIDKMMLFNHYSNNEVSSG